MKKIWLILIGLLASGCVAPQEQLSPQTPSAQPKESISEEALTRTSTGSAVSVDATFLNPIQKNKEELIFRVALNTHSVDLSGYKIEQLATFKNSEGLITKEGFVWVSESDSSHRRSGYLKIPAGTKEGKPLISEKTDYIVLEITGIEANREFRWKKDVLKLL